MTGSVAAMIHSPTVATAAVPTAGHPYLAAKTHGDVLRNKCPGRVTLARKEDTT